MPGCAAVGCNNSAKKGYLMKRFPKNPVRRKEWLIKMKRDKWTVTDYSCLCEVHFAPEMWERTRVDGTRKLKVNSVPTIFSFKPPEIPKRKAPRKRTFSTSEVYNMTPETLDGVPPEPLQIVSHHEEKAGPSVSYTVISSTSSKDSEDSREGDISQTVPDKDLLAKLAKYENMYIKEKRI